VKGQRSLGGTDGISVRTGAEGVQILDQFPTLLGIRLTGQQVPNTILLWVTAIIVIVSMLVMYRVVKSPFGRALDAIGQERTRARFLGLPVKRYVWAAFIMSGIYGGIAGGLYALYFRQVDPETTLQVFVSGDILYIAILGGFNTLTGPIIGGIVFETLANLADEVAIAGPAGETQMGRAITGAVLLLIVFVFPDGIVGSLKPGGRVYEGARTLKNDPSVIGPWIRQFGVASIDASKRALNNVRYLLLGVK
jgi:branched-chain amino acid transport system permease protein